MPFCRADPVRGAQVNVVGTVVLFEQVRQRQERMAPVVYAGSVGMFDAADADPASGRLTSDATAHPGTLYGVYKLANEGTAQVYWAEHGVASFGFRPMTVYGPGRDQGMTSTPTKAMAAAVLGRPYHISFGGTRSTSTHRTSPAPSSRPAGHGLDGARTRTWRAPRPTCATWSRSSSSSAVGGRDHHLRGAPLPFPDDIDSGLLSPWANCP